MMDHGWEERMNVRGMILAESWLSSSNLTFNTTRRMTKDPS